MRVWIEVELNSTWPTMYDVAENSNLNFTEFRQKDWLWDIGVKLSEEYYSSTIEYNFTPFEHSKKNFDRVSDYLDEEIEIHDLEISGDRPAFVWTHIHIFDEDKLRLSKPRLLAGVLWFIAENIDCLSRDSLKRLLLWHQLWWNWSWENNHKWKHMLTDFRYQPDYYSSSESRPKYNPIISSRATPAGKPQSLEIRLIPNEFMFNWKALELINLIDNRELYKNYKMKVTDFLLLVWSKLWLETRGAERARREQESWPSGTLRVEPIGMWATLNVADLQDARDMLAERCNIPTPSMYFDEGSNTTSDSASLLQNRRGMFYNLEEINWNSSDIIMNNVNDLDFLHGMFTYLSIVPYGSNNNRLEFIRYLDRHLRERLSNTNYNSSSRYSVDTTTNPVSVDFF